MSDEHPRLSAVPPVDPKPSPAMLKALRALEAEVAKVRAADPVVTPEAARAEYHARMVAARTQLKQLTCKCGGHGEIELRGGGWENCHECGGDE